MGFQGNRIAVRSAGHLGIISEQHGSWDNTLALYEGAGTIWAAGSSGLSFFDGQQFVRVHSNNEEIFDGTSGIAFDARGNLWLNAGAGALRINSVDVAHILSSKDHFAHVDIFNERDGLTGKPTQTRPTPSLISDLQGNLWFATAGHLTTLDPHKVEENKNDFEVVIESLLLDGKLFLTHGDETDIFRVKEASRHSLEINFAALDLSEPERMTYRYRLIGEDKDWQDAGSRRQAFYTRLRPAKYSFELSARLGQGAWRDLRRPLQIEILPAFYQTAWFGVLLALGVGFLIFIAVRLRIKDLAATIRQREEIRADERIRIARDLHDTLLQGVQGLTLRFNAAARQLPEGSRTRDSMESALVAADRLMEEGRNRVSRLRAPHVTYESLIKDLKIIAADLNFEKRVNFELEYDDRLLNMSSSILGELSYIGQEAITNAFRHSKGSSIQVKLRRLSIALILTIKDNGVGFDSESFHQAATAGHWGVYGMQERAKTIRAQFECTSQPNFGTEITVTVPARFAYEKEPQ